VPMPLLSSFLLNEACTNLCVGSARGNDLDVYSSGLAEEYPSRGSDVSFFISLFTLVPNFSLRYMILYNCFYLPFTHLSGRLLAVLTHLFILADV
jgi:hypothetical protein